MRGLAAAIAFLTTVPPPVRPASIARAVAWFPVVGAGIGLVVALALVGAGLVLPPLVAAAIALAAGLALTGALHEDGLADTFDAIGSGKSDSELVAVLRDPRVGAIGAAALVVSLVWRVAILAEMPGPEAIRALPAVHASSRAAMVGVMWASSPATPDGLAAAHLAELPSSRAVVAIASGLVAAVALLGLPTGAAAAAAGAAGWPIAAWARRRLGGVTGDVLGACQQAAEIAGLTVVVALS